jgi:hypothetical protein
MRCAPGPGRARAALAGVPPGLYAPPDIGTRRGGWQGAAVTQEESGTARAGRDEAARDHDAPAVPLARALEEAAQCFAALPGVLEAARVHDEAFGRLIDAQRVRDAYHDRLPATETNLAAAHDCAAHLLVRLAALEGLEAGAAAGQVPAPAGQSNAAEG